MFELVEEPWGFYAVMELADDEFDRESLEVSRLCIKVIGYFVQYEHAWIAHKGSGNCETLQLATRETDNGNIARKILI